MTLFRERDTTFGVGTEGSVIKPLEADSGTYATQDLVMIGEFLGKEGIKLAVKRGIALWERQEHAQLQSMDSAWKDMLSDSYTVVRALVAAKLGARPSDREVAEFFETRTEDPTFSARAHKLFIEGVKSPSRNRRLLLASALFGTSASTTEEYEEQERIDATIEKLFAQDVILLDRLASFTRRHGTIQILIDCTRIDRFAVPEFEYSTCNESKIETCTERVTCSVNSLVNLSITGCTTPQTPILGVGERYSLTPIDILPLGHSVLDLLRTIRDQIHQDTALH